MSSLNSFQSVWGFDSRLSVRSIRFLVISASSLMPRSAIFSRRSSLLVRCIGIVHLPLPMNGASRGAYLMVTIEWSDGMAVCFMSQSKVFFSMLFATYIQSSLTWILPVGVWALYVKAFSVGFACLHTSQISHSYLSSLSASIASSLSNLGGILSVASSVTLKSPRMMSGRGACCDRLSVIIFAQKAACSFLSFGA